MVASLTCATPCVCVLALRLLARAATADGYWLDEAETRSCARGFLSRVVLLEDTNKSVVCLWILSGPRLTPVLVFSAQLLFFVFSLCRALRSLFCPV